MTQVNKSPTFNMKVVVQETGIKPDTLRAWERRYGLPEPQRTSGGHRLYSQYDIDLLKWLLARLDEGMSISHAVTMWRQLEADGRDPLLASGPTSTAEPILASKKISGDRIAEAREGWIQACLGFQEADAQRILAQAFALFPVDLVCTELIQKGMAELGEGWYQGKVTVQQEHFASAIAVRQLEALLSSTAPATRHGRIVTACAPGEQHTFGLLLLTLMLRRQGWDVVYLGANVPLEQLQETLDQIQPNLVVLSAQTLPAVGAMLPVADMVQNARLLFAFGGVVFSQIPELHQRVPGYFLGVDLQQAPQQIEKIFSTSSPPDPALRADAIHQTALAHFREKRAAIETATQQSLGNESLRMDRIAMINQELSNNIVAALTLGDLHLLNANIDWVEGMLNNLEYPLSNDVLRHYLQTYVASAREHLDEQHGAIIVNWFTELLNTL